jgi:hypothetical protein
MATDDEGALASSSSFDYSIYNAVTNDQPTNLLPSVHLSSFIQGGCHVVGLK